MQTGTTMVIDDPAFIRNLSVKVETDYYQKVFIDDYRRDVTFR